MLLDNSGLCNRLTRKLKLLHLKEENQYIRKEGVMLSHPLSNS